MKGKRVAVAGTSYGGFVAYWLARAAGPARVGPVVIASSDLLKTAADDRGFLKMAGEGWGGVHELDHPCNCTGTIRFVHDHCQLRWIHISGRLHCDVCRREISTRLYTRTPRRPRRSRRGQRASSRSGQRGRSCRCSTSPWPSSSPGRSPCRSPPSAHGVSRSPVATRKLAAVFSRSSYPAPPSSPSLRSGRKAWSVPGTDEAWVAANSPRCASFRFHSGYLIGTLGEHMNHIYGVCCPDFLYAAGSKWRRHERKKWKSLLVIITLLLFMVGYVFYFI